MDPEYTLWRMVGDLLEVTCPSDAGEALCVSQKNTAAASMPSGNLTVCYGKSPCLLSNSSMNR